MLCLKLDITHLYISFVAHMYSLLLTCILSIEGNMNLQVVLDLVSSSMRHMYPFHTRHCYGQLLEYNALIFCYNQLGLTWMRVGWFVFSMTSLCMIILLVFLSYAHQSTHARVYVCVCVCCVCVETHVWVGGCGHACEWGRCIGGATCIGVGMCGCGCE